MREPTEIEKQHYKRFKELFAKSRQRYLEDGGDVRRCPSGRKGDDYLTDEERRELFDLGRQIFEVRTIGDEVRCQGKSWKITPKDGKSEVESQISKR